MAGRHLGIQHQMGHPHRTPQLQPILGTEFLWAQRVLQWVRDRYDSWMDWTRQQSPVVRLAAVALTGAVVLVTLWLVDAFGLVAGWVGLDWHWVRSPFA